MDSTTMDESTGLLSGDTTKRLSLRHRMFSVESRLLLAGFLISLAFNFTQNDLRIRELVCNAYYDGHVPFRGDGDSCALDSISAETAIHVSVLGMTTTFCGTVNLLLAGWFVKKRGPRFALMVQIFIPAIRVAIQTLGILVGKQAGLIIVQLSQLITLIGGPAGYLLVVNVIVGQIVEPSRCTAVFGRLQGCILLGQGLSYLVGGTVGDVFGVVAPFELAFVSFLMTTAYLYIGLPYLPPEKVTKDNSPRAVTKNASEFFAPIRALQPQWIQLSDGKQKRYWGVIILCAGIFMGVLATGYVPTLLQMYATISFDFDQSHNGYLMTFFALMRGMFLIFIFPAIISFGRKRVSPPQSPEQDHVSMPANLPETHKFDLIFLKWNLLLDGALTALAALATQSWHVYLAALLLPLGSGSAPAAKGVISQLSSSSRRSDALNAITLIENVALLATRALFGFVFASLAAVGKSYGTFLCNAGVAILGTAVLMFVQFPPGGAGFINEEDNQHDDRTD